MFYLTMFWDYLKAYMKTRMTYRSDFWIEVFTDLLFQGMNLLFILVVFGHTDLLGGWNRNEIIFIYGYFMIPYGIFACFFNLWDFTERYIVKGEMDRILTRPAYNLVQLLLENVSPPSLLGAVTGGIIMGYAWISLGLPFEWYTPLALLLFIAGSVMIYAGIYIVLTAISFFSDSPTGILPLMWNIQQYGRYPVNIYNKIMKFVLTWMIPFAFVGVYPSAFFLDKETVAGFAFLTPLVGAVFLTVGISIWNVGIRKYRGAGS
ncbi:ABC transporter permease [Marinicrinis sediminis]|uniref:ABC transporter permease n=1 Tax=Marinicrinis sediminis TaxID=1652465 RepID=A0ABW5RF18_9BACL